jgi:hypothetical protein
MLGCSLGACVGLSIGSTTQTDDDDSENKSTTIHQLQNIMDDIMTNQQEIWYKQNCTCTLFVNDTPAVLNNNGISESSTSRSRRSSTIRSLQSTNDTTSSMAKQCAESSSIMASENTIYIPILKNNSNVVLGVMMIEQQVSGTTNYVTSNSLNTTTTLDDAKVVARTVGYFMTHVMKMD